MNCLTLSDFTLLLILSFSWLFIYLIIVGFKNFLILSKYNKMKADYWYGHIFEIRNDEILCILKKDYELNKELIIDKESLTDEQKSMLCIGLAVRYNIPKKHIEFLS